jgi:hypothetical protein
MYSSQFSVPAVAYHQDYGHGHDNMDRQPSDREEEAPHGPDDWDQADSNHNFKASPA